jgi:predicted AlkP superfamily pyrophosphatase or phosphodiesterase
VKIRHTFAALLAGLAAALALGVFRPMPRATAAGAPRLVLFISVDQMRYDYLTRFVPLYRGGFKTLLERGAVFSNALYRHGNTETGPGHSVLLSGRNGWHSGIVANQWFDSVLKKDVNVVEDPAVVNIGGSVGGYGASPANFSGFTVGDMLKKRTPGSRVVGVSLKDRSAILMAGPRADAAYWFDTGSGGFVTSTYYAKTPPAWLTQWNARRLADSLQWRTWSRLLPDEAPYLKYAGPDDVKGEWDGVDTVFPHRVREAPPSPKFYDDLRRTPFGDEMVLDAALAAMTAHELGADDDPDLFAVGFSSSDVIGHTYGMDSQEQMDEYLRLDLTLGRLLAEVDRRVGLDRVILGLSADHGSMPLVETLKARGLPARRIRPADILDPVTSALEARFGPLSGLVARDSAPDFYLDVQAIARRGLRRADVEAVAEKALMATGLVERVYTHERMLGDPPADDPYFALMRRSFYEPRSPHLIVLLKDWIYMSERPGGTGHGTPYEHDRHVPVVFFGASVKPGTYPAACGPEDIAPSLAALLRLDYPLQDADRVLSEMIRTE